MSLCQWCGCETGTAGDHPSRNDCIRALRIHKRHLEEELREARTAADRVRDQRNDLLEELSRTVSGSQQI